MITYSLYIHVDDEFEDPRSTLSTAAIDAANAIEMRHSEYFTWIDDEQESLSRSNAINLAEKDMQEYLHVKQHLWWFISNSADKSRQGQVKQEAAL